MGVKGQQEDVIQQGNQQPDDFDAAFAEATSEAPGDDEQHIETDGAEQADTEQGAAPESESQEQDGDQQPEQSEQHDDEDADEGDGADESDAPKPAKPAKAHRKADDDEDSPEKWKQRYLSLQGKFNKLVEQQKQQPQPQQPDTGEADQGAGKDEADLDDEDERLLAELDEELPLVSKAVRKLLAKQEKQLLQRVEQQLAPVANTVRSDAEQRHFAAIMDAHKDFEDVIAGDELYEYIEKQPAYIQNGMRQVLTRGTAAEVIDLLTRFKSETGYGQQQQQSDSGQARESQKERQQLQQRRQRQMEDAGAVRAKGGPRLPSSKPKAESFEDAFDEALARG